MPLDADLFPKSTVRVRVNRVHNGTGFFVAPAIVVTCAHVINPRGVTVETIDLLDVDGRVHEVHPPQPTHVWPDRDLAILKLVTAADLPCVLLDPTPLELEDDVQSFGYPKSDRGEPVTYKAEGEAVTGLPVDGSAAAGEPLRWTKLKGGQAVHGMSGSPVLNVKTGGVYGVLSRSRDPRQDIGALAIAIRELFALDPTLPAQNLLFHETDTRWVDLLDAEQRRRLPPELRTTQVDLPVVHIILVVGPGVVVRASFGPDEPDLVSEGVDLEPVRVNVARLFRDWASRGRVNQGEQVRLLGEILYRALFQGDTAKRFAELLAKQKDRILLTLCFAPEMEEDLRLLPWEHAFAPEFESSEGFVNDTQLAADLWGFERSLVARRPKSAKRPTPRPGLSIVAVAGDDRVESVRRAFGDVAGTGARVTGTVVKPLPNPAPTALSSDIDSGGYDVLHYVGAGRYVSGSDQLALGAEYGGGPEYYDQDQLAECIQQHKPRLVVLQVCEGPPDTVSPDLTRLARSLVAKGVMAVVVYQYPIEPEFAKEFNDALYTDLVSGRALQAAVRAARQKIRLKPNRRAFVSAALFVREPGPLHLAPAPVAVAVQTQQAGVYATVGSSG